MFIQNLENHFYVFCPKIYGIVDCMQHIKMSVSSEKSRHLTRLFAQVCSQVESWELKPLETVNSVNSANSVNSVNSVNSYSAVLPPSPMVFYILEFSSLISAFQRPLPELLYISLIVVVHLLSRNGNITAPLRPAIPYFHQLYK